MNTADFLITQGTSLRVEMPRINASSNCTLPEPRNNCASAITAHIANIILGVASHSIWAQNKSADKILIFNLMMSCLVMLVGLFLHIIAIINMDLFLACDSTIYSVYKFRNSTYISAILATLATLVAIGYDRFEALTKFPGQRKLTVSLSWALAILTWGVTTAVAVILYRGPLEPKCDKKCVKPDLTLAISSNHANAHLLGRALMVSAYIFICCVLTVTSLLRATWAIRRHHQQIEAMYGVMRARKEVDFTKVCAAIMVTYILMWSPSALSQVVRSSRPSLRTLCANYWLTSLAFSSALLVPVIYITLDKRLWKGLTRRKRRFRDEQQREHSRSLNQSSVTMFSHVIHNSTTTPF
ncbi:uncharacterized protein LOC125559786 [Nematostella vectensis]|uniref:uncharacterized protein LOC125559786 n=1 Tax=Nematostella vectensis TaxID=45351 RepID=UPI0020772360|nr:uncharacterized protein LOC125559786 [Nematostella vectensis]